MDNQRLAAPYAEMRGTDDLREVGSHDSRLMSLVYFTSDLHLGHEMAAEIRGFENLREHDDAIIESFGVMTKRDKLFVLGDVAMGIGQETSLWRLRGMPTQNMVLVLGNHDVLAAATYLAVFVNIIGPQTYRKYWLSHIPIHPQEVFSRRGNIHGHIHKGGMTGPLGHPYFNVNWDFHRGPVLFTDIEKWSDEHEEHERTLDRGMENRDR